MFDNFLRIGNLQFRTSNHFERLQKAPNFEPIQPEMAQPKFKSGKKPELRTQVPQPLP